jgi:hypothetical protein
MQIHALGLEDFCEEEYSLIGIHTALEDYKLAYLLNKNLNTHFSKSQKNLEFESDKKRASFSIYNFSSKKYDFDWFLIANSFKRENQTESNELLLTTETKTYLIPEKKKVDFFIKIYFLHFFIGKNIGSKLTHYFFIFRLGIFKTRFPPFFH